MRIILLLFLLTAPATASERAAFYGSWGTEKQCARALLKPGGTVTAEPYVISAQWLKQGQLWCALNWFPVAPRENGWFTGAFASCGEDAVRAYMLGMELTGNQLTLRWNFPTKIGPLMQCQGQ